MAGDERLFVRCLGRTGISEFFNFRSIRHLPWQKQHSAIAKNQQHFRSYLDLVQSG
jgi:hypothetical protein